MNAIHGADLPFNNFLEHAKDWIIGKRAEYSLMGLGSLILPYIRNAPLHADLFE